MTKLVYVLSFFSAENQIARQREMAFSFKIKPIWGVSFTAAIQEIEKRAHWARASDSLYAT